MPVALSTVAQGNAGIDGRLFQRWNVFERNRYGEYCRWLRQYNVHHRRQPVFSALSVTTTTGKTLLFTAGATTSVNPWSFDIAGAPGNLLKVRSTVPGTPAKFNLLGTQNIRFVDVADNHGTGLTLAPGLPSASNSVNSGNVFNWFDVCRSFLRCPLRA